jgi:2-polyprenyl-3-methyl-5-hydroxy-6-metoxy-1,4-benzoquinol methylase
MTRAVTLRREVRVSNDPEYEDFEVVVACPLCHGKRFRTIDTVGNVAACSRCGYRFVSPRPTQDEVTRGYSAPTAYSTWLTEVGPRRELWQRRFDNVLGTWPRGSLLDVGAGLGTFLSIAADRGWTVAGTEVSSTAIRYVAATYGIELVHGQLDEVELATRFDVITLWHVIEHVPDPVLTLRACRTLLAPGGRVVLALPNDSAAAQALSSSVRLVRRVLRRSTRPRYEHLRPGTESHVSHFNPRTMRLALRSAGLEPEIEDVDDAAPSRSTLGRLVFGVRCALTRVTPWNFATEMLIVARIKGE